MGLFQTTRWSLVLSARGGELQARGALDTLCTCYRPSLLIYLRKRGYATDVAEDLLQAFFLKFIEQRGHSSADPQRGRFRTFLLTALQNFLADQHDKACAQKRGGNDPGVALDDALAGEIADSDEESPEHAFDRVWALTLLERAMARLRGDAERAGKLALFDGLKEFLFEQPDQEGYAAAANALNMRANTLAVTVHRMRGRLREMIRAELAETVSNKSELDEELRDLRGVLGGS